MTAKAVCEIAFHATRAGAKGVGDFALDPASPGQHFADHLGRALGLPSVAENSTLQESPCGIEPRAQGK
eukprot:10930730-Alexandrium_andersonii.AAC.1